MASPSMAQNGKADAEQISRAQPAGVITVKREPIPVTVTLSGQALAEDDATIRPLVDGVITGILYQAGTTVKKVTCCFKLNKILIEPHWKPLVPDWTALRRQYHRRRKIFLVTNNWLAPA